MPRWLEAVMRAERRRLREVFLVRETDQLEVWVGLAFLLRAYWMLDKEWNSIPIEVQGYLVPRWFTEPEWGLILGVIAVGQLLSAHRRAPLLRGIVATLGAGVQGMAGYAYWHSDQFWRGVVPLIVTLVLAEMFIAFRAWSDILGQRGQRAGSDRRHA